MRDTSAAREAIRTAREHHRDVMAGMSSAEMKLQAAAGMFRNNDPPPAWPEDHPVWIIHAGHGLNAALTACDALREAIAAALGEVARLAGEDGGDDEQGPAMPDDLTLREWAEREDIPYPTAYGWYRAGLILGARKAGSRIMVPASTEYAPAARPGPDPLKRYRVSLCLHCGHPGGAHIIDAACRLCRDCPGWGDQHGIPGYWCDRQTDELRAAMEAGDA